MNLEQIGIQAKQVSYQLASLSTEQKIRWSVILYGKIGVQS